MGVMTYSNPDKCNTINKYIMMKNGRRVVFSITKPHEFPTADGMTFCNFTTVKQAAEYMGISERQLRRIVTNSDIETISLDVYKTTVRKQKFVNVSDLMKYRDEHNKI